MLEDNGWEVPETIEDMETIMDEAMEKGLYASVTGNKGWQPVNENYASLFLTHIATPDTVYKCLTGEESWDNDDVKAANVEGAIDAATIDGSLYAFPRAADNGYFLYYDSSVISEEDAANWDSLLEAADKAGKKLV